MNPLKVKDQAREYAREHGIDEQDMQDIVDFFYSRLLSHLRDLKHLNIHMPEVGTWNFVKSKVVTGIAHYSKKVQRQINYAQVDDDKKMLERFRNIEKLIEIRAEKKKRVSEIRKEYEEKRTKGEPWTPDDRRRAYTYWSMEQILKDRGDRGTLPTETEGMQGDK